MVSCLLPGAGRRGGPHARPSPSRLSASQGRRTCTPGFSRGVRINRVILTCVCKRFLPCDIYVALPASPATGSSSQLPRGLDHNVIFSAQKWPVPASFVIFLVITLQLHIHSPHAHIFTAHFIKSPILNQAAIKKKLHVFNKRLFGNRPRLKRQSNFPTNRL